MALFGNRLAAGAPAAPAQLDRMTDRSAVARVDVISSRPLSRFLRIHKYEQDTARLRAVIDPSVICCLLHDHIPLL